MHETDNSIFSKTVVVDTLVNSFEINTVTGTFFYLKECKAVVKVDKLMNIFIFFITHE